MVKKASVTFFMVLFAVLLVHSQEDWKKTIRQADNQYDKGNYAKALPAYLKFASAFESGIVSREVLNFKIGFCYYNTDDEKELAISYFEKYLAVTDSIEDANYFLAKLYHLYHRFDDAIAKYKKFRESVERDSLAPKDIIHEVTSTIDREIERCNYGRVLINNPNEVIVENLGEDINSAYSEYAPVITPDETKIVFTKRSPETTGGKMAHDGDYYEDIYISELEKGSLFKPDSERESSDKSGFFSTVTDFKFSPPVGISPNVNSKTHEGAIQFSYDGKKLFIYRDFNVWVSNKTEEGWAAPTAITELANALDAKAFEPSVSISINGDAIYIASNRKGGYGGLDIYKATKNPDGTWSKAKNLGPEINTKYDEDSPYIDPDGRTLYFSSTGLSSMGGFDIFKSVYKEGGWAEPKNLGYPVNSAGNDIFFMMTPRYNRGYYSSNKPDGYGKMDLYRLTFANERSPLAEVKGLVLKGDTLVPAFSRITIYDPKNGDEISTHYSDSVSGEYLLLFAHGEGYKIRVETNGFAPYQKNFNMPRQLDYYQYYQEIHHVYIKDRLGNIIGQKISMYNAVLEEDSAGTDTVFYTGEDVSESFSEFVKKKSNTQKTTVQEISDVKFYISEDSLITLIKQQPDLKFDFDEAATVSYFDPKEKNMKKTDETAFVPAKNRSLVLTETTSEEEISSALKPDIDTLVAVEHNPGTQNEVEELPTLLLYFEYEKEELRNEAKNKLKSFIEFLEKNPEVQIAIIGHTDAKGSDNYNLRLSIKRASSVYDYLIKKGIDNSRLSVIGKGEKQPIARNVHEDGSDNPRGRAINRRVEFKRVN